MQQLHEAQRHASVSWMTAMRGTVHGRMVSGGEGERRKEGWARSISALVWSSCHGNKGWWRRMDLGVSIHRCIFGYNFSSLNFTFSDALCTPNSTRLSLCWFCTTDSFGSRGFKRWMMRQIIWARIDLVYPSGKRGWSYLRAHFLDWPLDVRSGQIILLTKSSWVTKHWGHLKITGSSYK